MYCARQFWYKSQREFRATATIVLTEYLADVRWRGPFGLTRQQGEIIFKKLLILKSVFEHASLLIVRYHLDVLKIFVQYLHTRARAACCETGVWLCFRKRYPSRPSYPLSYRGHDIRSAAAKSPPESSEL
jgi:hypothetical protein